MGWGEGGGREANSDDCKYKLVPLYLLLLHDRYAAAACMPEFLWSSRTV